MRRLYLIVSAQVLADLVRELQADGLAEQDMQLFARNPKRLPDLPVSVTALRVQVATPLLRSGAAALLGFLALILVSALGVAVLQSVELVVLVIIAAAGAGLATAFLHPFPPELRPLRGELRREDVVMRVEVPDERLESLETGIKERFPEVRVKGTDPSGSPPFP